MARGLIVVDRFADEASAMRDVFDARFADPRRASGDRFVWDWWHVPGQYTALRTPAWTYFPTTLYAQFHRNLVAWGRETLGCHDISPPWLSCYVDGCRQELHGDLPHGPWAFVLSLTPKRAFRGGETLMLRDEVLEFWHDFASVRAVEEGELVRAIEPRFNRLIAFDPRIPHGVRQVSGTLDPREGRLVVHGWFVQPRPFIRGPLRAAAVSARVADLTGSIATLVDELPVAGLLSVAIDVRATGTIASVTVLSDTTRTPRDFEPARRRLVRGIRAAIAGWSFSRQRAPTRITLPLVFERG